MDAEELRASAAELAEAQRVAHIGNWTFDLQTQKVTWSDELYRIFEIDHRDFLAGLRKRRADCTRAPSLSPEP